MNDQPNAPWVTLIFAFGYMGVFEGLVVRDTNNGGMARSLINQADLTPRKERIR